MREAHDIFLDPNDGENKLQNQTFRSVRMLESGVMQLDVM